MLDTYKKNLLNRFLEYVKIDTQSDENSKNCPSTSKQINLAKRLEQELISLGLSNVRLNENCYLTANLPSNSKNDVPTVGFISHIDTSPDMSGKDVKPRIIENYNGEDIVLNKENNVILSFKEFPKLKKYIGQTLITTDGKTLLGADDKAGIAEIMTALEYLIDHPDIKHGQLRVGFTPDEEIGRGADLFDVKEFDADYAFTIDGGEVGELEYENFNAASAKVYFKGKNVHPGTAKGIMINSGLLAMEFNSMLPSHKIPEYTEGYEGFYHLIKMEGKVENSFLQYIIRDHDKLKFEVMKKELIRIVNYMNEKYGDNIITLELKDQYYNMKKKIESVFHIIELAKSAYLNSDIKPKIIPIRGGTDGARLSFMGLPTPNIFTGGHNFHGKYEYIPFNSMVKAVEVIINIIKLFNEQFKI